MKKVLSAVLALAMVFSLSCTAFAVEKVCIVNGGSKSITGAMQYEVK